MGARGTKRKPTAIKRLEGNPGKRPLPRSEAAPRRADLKPPNGIGTEAKRRWHEVVDALPPGLVTAADLPMLRVYADAWQTYHDAGKTIKRTGLIARSERTGTVYQHPAVGIRNQAAALIGRTAAKFGLTPSDRAGLEMPEQGESKLKKYGIVG